jgi:hypothetical protein
VNRRRVGSGTGPRWARRIRYSGSVAPRALWRPITMLAARWKTVRQHLPRRLFAGFALVAYLTAAVGFPLPVPAPAEGGQPCRCPPPDRCRHQCCCFKPGGRLAGARAGDGELAPSDAKPVRANPGLRIPGSCCSPRKTKSGPATTEHPACCSGGNHRPACCVKPTAATPPEPPSRVSDAGVRWVPGLSAPSCQGVTTYWVTGGAALPPPPAVSWGPRLDPAGWLPLLDSFTSLLPSVPPDPPPRTSRA